MKVWKKIKKNLIDLVSMADNEKWEAQDVIEEDDEHFDPLLDDGDSYGRKT